MSNARLIKQIKNTRAKLKELELELAQSQKQCKHDYSPNFVCTTCKYQLLTNLNTNKGISELSRLKELYTINNNKIGLSSIKMICAFHNMLHIGFPNYDRL